MLERVNCPQTVHLLAVVIVERIALAIVMGLRNITTRVSATSCQLAQGVVYCLANDSEVPASPIAGGELYRRRDRCTSVRSRSCWCDTCCTRYYREFRDLRYGRYSWQGSGHVLEGTRRFSSGSAAFSRDQRVSRLVQLYHRHYVYQGNLQNKPLNRSFTSFTGRRSRGPQHSVGKRSIYIYSTLQSLPKGDG